MCWNDLHPRTTESKAIVRPEFLAYEPYQPCTVALPLHYVQMKITPGYVKVQTEHTLQSFWCHPIISLWYMWFLSITTCNIRKTTEKRSNYTFRSSEPTAQKVKLYFYEQFGYQVLLKTISQMILQEMLYVTEMVYVAGI